MPIVIEELRKTYEAGSHSYTALKGINLEIQDGEFVAIIGKSGSGKSTLINMLTGIDVPTTGTVTLNGVNIHNLRSSELTRWRGRNMGIIFQFFQLMPTLTLLENVMLPMDFCNLYSARERKRKAMQLLDQVGMADHMGKLPAAVSGGQQQRVAIARALANDPPFIIADEPTGSLDSKTAEAVFQLFLDFSKQGKTVVMVTHDNDLASRVHRSVIVADGEVVNQYIVAALPALDVDQFTYLQQNFERRVYDAGTVIIRQGEEATEAYFIVRGEVEVVVHHPGGQEIVVNRLTAGQYFGEMALVQGGRRTATVRAGADSPVELMALHKEAFADLLNESAATRDDIQAATTRRMEELIKAGDLMNDAPTPLA